MRRQLVRTNAFIRAAKRFLKRQPEEIEPLGSALALMEENVFDPRLRTHELKGDLSGMWPAAAAMTCELCFGSFRTPKRK